MPKVDGFTLRLSGAEARVLYEELGDVPKKRLGPKLLALYRRLDALFELEWKPPRKNARVQED